jgi:hypothetical protein
MASWATRFQRRQRLKGSLWMVPLRGLLAIGEERTIEQDPAFALRIRRSGAGRRAGGRVERVVPHPRNRAFASRPDAQGIGGPSSTEATFIAS